MASPKKANQQTSNVISDMDAGNPLGVPVFAPISIPGRPGPHIRSGIPTKLAKNARLSCTPDRPMACRHVAQLADDWK